MYYELATLTLPFGTTAQAAQNVLAYTSDTAASGELLGCWYSDIGQLNQLLVLRGFDSLPALEAEQQRTRLSADPYGCGSLASSIDRQAYQAFPWMAPLRPSSESGISGPVYEIRTYGIKTGGLQHTMDLWQEYLPPRSALSPCLVAMFALQGPLRFTNIWAYASVDERSRIRGEAVAAGIWPPKGGPAWLTTDMHSTIALPTAVSPLK